MSVLNSTIIEKAWLEGSNDFQQRIPNPSINSYGKVVSDLFEPMNNDLFNQFTGLLNGLMGTYIETKLFENPLRVLKKPFDGNYTRGNSERHVAVKYLQAHSYKMDDETLLKLERPEFVEWFYSVTDPRRYEFSWSRYELQRAFAADDTGFDDLLTATINQAYSSDNYDEMNIMIQMFAEADQRMGGIYRHQLSAAPSDEATGKELLRGVRAVAGRMQFPSILYNHIDVPVFETPGEDGSLIFWCTPEVLAVLDVDTLSSVFQLDRAQVQYRIIVIPEFPIPNVYAALTGEDFIYCRDIWYGVEPPFYNPANLTYKYYLHHAQMIGVNPAANAVLFTTDENTAIPTIEVDVTGLAFTPAVYGTYPGGTVQTSLQLQGSVIGNSTGKIAVEPDAATYAVSGTRESAALALNSRTYVDERGILHVQKTGLQAGDVLTITATSLYTNPSGSTTVYTATATVNITAATDLGEKECAVETNPYITYTDETTEATASE